MKCKKIQEIIITDYIDGQAPPKVKAEIDAHLADCPECRQFAQAVQEEAVAPFKSVSEIKPPEQVWFNIRQTIATQRSWLDWLRDMHLSWRPAMAVAVALIIALGALIYTRLPVSKAPEVNNYLAEQASFLASLRSEDEVPGEQEGGNVAPNAEEYFL